MEQKLSPKTVNLVSKIVKGIAFNPEIVAITVTEERDEIGDFTKLKIKVSECDVPRMIGKGGSTIESIRKLAVMSANRNGYKKVLLLQIDAPNLEKKHEKLETTEA